MPNKNLVRNKNGSWDSVTEPLPAEIEQKNKVVKASAYAEPLKPEKQTKQTAAAVVK